MSDEAPRFRSHYLPRTGPGRVAVLAFFAIFVFAQPPLVFVLANRVEPWVLGLPFLYAYLLLVYLAAIAVLLWVKSRDL